MIWIVAIVALTKSSLTGSGVPYECHTPSNCNTFGLKICARTKEKDTKSSHIFFAIVLSMELLFTSFFLFLFLKPLRRLRRMQGITTRRQREMVRINVFGTFLGMITSYITEIYFFTGFGSYHFQAFDS